MARAAVVVVLLAGVALAPPVAQARTNRWEVVAPYNASLERIAWCESRKRWWLATGNGYYGGLQFALATWRGVGGRGWPHQASRLEQKFRAVLLRKRIGRWDSTAGWPVCGRFA